MSEGGLEHLRRACWRLFRIAALSDLSRAFGPSRVLACWSNVGRDWEIRQMLGRRAVSLGAPTLSCPPYPDRAMPSGWTPAVSAVDYGPHKRLGWIAAILATGVEVAGPILLHWGVGPRAGGWGPVRLSIRCADSEPIGPISEQWRWAIMRVEGRRRFGGGAPRRIHQSWGRERKIVANHSHRPPSRSDLGDVQRPSTVGGVDRTPQPLALASCRD